MLTVAMLQMYRRRSPVELDEVLQDGCGAVGPSLCRRAPQRISKLSDPAVETADCRAKGAEIPAPLRSFQKLPSTDVFLLLLRGLEYSQGGFSNVTSGEIMATDDKMYCIEKYVFGFRSWAVCGSWGLIVGSVASISSPIDSPHMYYAHFVLTGLRGPEAARPHSVILTP